MANCKVQAFFDKDTNTITYIVFDPKTRDAIIIDPVLDYEQAASEISFESIDKVQSFLAEESLNPLYVLETHAHADHLTGAMELKKRIPSLKIAIGKNITKVQSLFGKIYNLKDFNTNGVQFDKLLDEGEDFQVGPILVKTIFTPGHTPACSSYLIEDMVFTGDALFMPDFGTGRCDFPGGSARDLYHSVHEKLYKLPDETRVFTCHDYQPNGRDLKYESTIKEQKLSNIQLKEETTENEFVTFRENRDRQLKTPKLLIPSIQVNIDGGNLPDKEDNGVSYLKVPINSK